MSQTVDFMLARWFLLYPEGMQEYREGMGHEEDEGSRAGEIASVKSGVIAPILESGDMARVFVEMRRNYRHWTRSLPGAEDDPELVMSLEDRKDDVLVGALGGRREYLGERSLRAMLEGIRLRGIVRHSTIPHRENWPEESWRRIGNLLADNELCNLAIIHHLATGEGDRGRIETLAAWGFQYAQNAYFDAGDNGQDPVPLKDMPE